jgi:hypothetical protein
MPILQSANLALQALLDYYRHPALGPGRACAQAVRRASRFSICPIKQWEHGMIKMVTLMRKREGMTREELIDYYENKHVPLSMELFPQIVKMTRNFPVTDNFHYVSSAAMPKVPYDVVTEHWFADQSSYDKMMADFAGDPDKFQRLSDDEGMFCDKDSVLMFMVDERETKR